MQVMITKTNSPDRIDTVWSRPSTACFGTRFSRVKMADPPALTLSLMKVPNFEIPEEPVRICLSFRQPFEVYLILFPSDLR